MNLLYIIGNGFDINLGLKTGYQDFYDFYRDVDTQDPDILAMKDSIEKGRYSTWSDLEAGLGKYTMQVNDPVVFTKCLVDIKQNLSRYLGIQYQTKHFGSDYKKISDDLYHPEKYLDEQVANAFHYFCLSFESSYLHNTELFLVTLNYTDTLEDLLVNKLGHSYRILHIHGRLKDDIVMGVSDMAQIANVVFHDNRDVREEFIKPEYNNACLNARNSSFEGMINLADVIVLFGTSLGETDRKWWRLIGKRLTDNSKRTALIYFPYDSKKDTNRHPNYRLRWTEGYQKDLLKVFEIPEDQYEDVLSRVFIGINQSIFKLPKKSLS